MRNATLAGIQDLKVDVDDVHGGVKDNLALTEQIGYNANLIVAKTGQIQHYLESEILPSFSLLLRD